MGRSLLKWLVAPLAAIGAGYYLLGPKLAGDDRIKALVAKGTEAVRSGPAREEEPVDEDAPKVSVGVRPVEERSRRR
jgi:hypothetical protein